MYILKSACMMIEADAFPAGWLVTVRCVTLWLRVIMNPLFEGRILWTAALETTKSSEGWMKNLKVPGVLQLV